jgi:AraC family transcriptional regulator, transcriptional activator of pobA
MEKIARYDIATIQKGLNANVIKRDFFFLEKDKYDIVPEGPYRTETYGIGLFRKAALKLKTGLFTHRVESPAIVTMGPSVIRSWEKSDENVFSSLLFFTEQFFLHNSANVFALKSFDFFEKNDCHVLKPDGSTLNKIESIMTQIKNTLASPHIHEQAIIRSYISLLIHEIDAAHQTRNSRDNEKAQPSKILVDRFKVILSEEFKRQRSVSFYAEKLNITPKYFSSVIKEQTGKTAGEWIDEMVTLEAKVLLQNKALTIAQVADQLNFNDPSTFGKFFKTNANLSPLDYRKTLK